MNKIIFVFAVLMLANQAVYAADQGCEAKAAEKKLAGAAKTSFIKKCEKDASVNTAQTGCESKAAEKKLKGAAKTSFTKKCIADASK